MNELTNTQDEKLKRGVSMLYDMECNNYLMTRAISELDSRISSLGNYSYIPKPVRAEGKIDYGDSIILSTYILAVAGGIFGAIFGFINTDGIFLKLLGAVIGILLYGLGGGILGIVIGIVIGYIRISRENKRIYESYKYSCRLYKKRLDEEKIRIQPELKEREYLIAQRDILKDRLRTATEKLAAYYERMNIDSQFRGIISIGYMHKYMELGISFKLQGMDGLYYLIMQELRWEQLQYSLQQISERLDNIIGNQNRLYDDLQRLNDKCDDIIEQTIGSISALSKSNQLLAGIKHDTALTSYNTQRIAEEEAFRNFMLLY